MHVHSLCSSSNPKQRQTTIGALAVGCHQHDTVVPAKGAVAQVTALVGLEFNELIHVKRSERTSAFDTLHEVQAQYVGSPIWLVTRASTTTGSSSTCAGGDGNDANAKCKPGWT